MLAGDYNVMPREFDVYKPERWVNDTLFRDEIRDAFKNLVAQGWTDALRKCTRTSVFACRPEAFGLRKTREVKREQRF
ncbi:hypothetical protein SAMN02927900_06367 [Rhizobium mongolense subsp. loessense]|uniref:Uncharacterized protein n=1 Tax=Rhizobium mongolense subsp. loessense TaxID=158890 RepID=A0A1G4U8X6_9HYPH|nr:hypothetical protein SAMN02927900_06367 [Rhizobium mongolense subsp. loessense]